LKEISRIRKVHDLY